MVHSAARLTVHAESTHRRLEHEVKYLVPASATPSLLAWVHGTCRPDPVHPPASVCTVYYDTPGYTLLHDKIDSYFLKTGSQVYRAFPLLGLSIFSARPAILRRHAESYLGTGESVRLTVSGKGSAVTIDGRPAEPGWSGYYFPGMTARLSVRAGEAARLSHWLVNGTAVHAADLALALNQNTRVEAVWR
jgi:hypothetical protein